jgi:hypothetical protein
VIGHMVMVTWLYFHAPQASLLSHSVYLSICDSLYHPAIDYECGTKGFWAICTGTGTRPGDYADWYGKGTGWERLDGKSLMDEMTFKISLKGSILGNSADLAL